MCILMALTVTEHYAVTEHYNWLQMKTESGPVYGLSSLYDQFSKFETVSSIWKKH